MAVRLCLLAFLTGTATVLFGPVVAIPWSLPVSVLILGVGAIAVLCVMRTRHRLLMPCVAIVWSAIAGFLITFERMDARHHDQLHPDNEHQVVRVLVRVDSLPKHNPANRQFVGYVLQAHPAGTPQTVQITWSAPGWSGPYGSAKPASANEPDSFTFPDLVPGQIWRMAVTLKTPYGVSNPHGFDYERHMFAQGIRATGSVRGEPELVADDPWASVSVVADRARYAIRKAMLPSLQGMRYAGVLLALTIGDQASISADDWLIFNRSGLSHAVAISGSHVTLIAAIGGVAMLWLWRRTVWRGRSACEFMPAQVAGALGALVVAWLYCLLAGWGVPAQRTFLMLCVVAVAYLIRLPVTCSRLLCVVAVIVVLLDPWSLMSTGFWLSFAAVGVLMVSAGRDGTVRLHPVGRWARIYQSLRTATIIQWAVTLALAPFLAVLFHDVSIASPLVNAYALPVIGLWVTPLALLVGLFSCVPLLDACAPWLAWLAHTPLEWVMYPTVWIAQSEWASLSVPAVPWYWVALAVLGVFLAIQLHGLPGRQGAWLLMLPMLTWQPGRIRAGEWVVHALDVGQGSALVVQTAHHALLFDSGPRAGPSSEAGTSIIVPFLRAHGIRRLDVLVLSHADLDHVGGASSILRSLPVSDLYASFEPIDFFRREAAALEQAPPGMPLHHAVCRYGMTWHVDGVTFAFLWPTDTYAAENSAAASPDRNAASCVLSVQGSHHSALLTGDIGHAQEKELVARGLPAYDVVVAGHHGSRTSSDAAFVHATQAQHVVAQMGRANRYGHPHQEVLDQWQAVGARFWRTDLMGAVRVYSEAGGLDITAHRMSHRRHWHERIQGSQ